MCRIVPDTTYIGVPLIIGVLLSPNLYAHAPTRAQYVGNHSIGHQYVGNHSIGHHPAHRSSVRPVRLHSCGGGDDSDAFVSFGFCCPERLYAGSCERI
jgi:hypothetical protein